MKIMHYSSVYLAYRGDEYPELLGVFMSEEGAVEHFEDLNPRDKFIWEGSEEDLNWTILDQDTEEMVDYFFIRRETLRF